MVEMDVNWTFERIDDGEDPDPESGECLLKIKGRIEYEGQAAGLVDAFYLFAVEPESPNSFMELWDLDGYTCDVFEKIIAPGRRAFRPPIPEILEPASGILCARLIALRPPFRRKGLGRMAMDMLVRNFSDLRTGMVLLDSQPLQHRPRGYDDFDDEVRELPWNAPEEDLTRLMDHFCSWGMRTVPGTHFVLAAPQDLIDSPGTDWHPGMFFDSDDEWNA